MTRKRNVWKESIEVLATDKEAERIFNEILESRHKDIKRKSRFKF